MVGSFRRKFWCVLRQLHHSMPRLDNLGVSHDSRTDASVPHSRKPDQCRHTVVSRNGFCKFIVLSARTDVCALDGSSLHIGCPEQGGTSVGTRAWGL